MRSDLHRRWWQSVVAGGQIIPAVKVET
eukprot:IDg7927t1